MMSAWIKLIEMRILKIQNVRHLALKTSLLLVFLCVIWLVVGARISTSFMDWSWTEGFYAAFVRFSTIGYGDYLMDYEKVGKFGELISWYTNIGLALAAGVFDALSSVMHPKDRREAMDPKGELKESRSVSIEEISVKGNINKGIEMKEYDVRQQPNNLAAM